MKFAHDWHVIKALPLIIASGTLCLGYAFMQHESVAVRVCGMLIIERCDAFAFSGPIYVLGQWLVGAGVVMLAAPKQIVRPWMLFAGAFLIGTAVGVSYTSPSAFMFNRIEVSALFGALLLIITICWVATHAIVSRRRAKRT